MHHFLCYPTATLIILGLALACVAGAILLHWSFWFGVALFAAALWLDISGSRWQALYGDVNPAIVVSTEPFLVAVSTDLTTGGDSYPAIKVLRQPLQRMTGGPPQLGAQAGDGGRLHGHGRRR